MWLQQRRSLHQWQLIFPSLGHSSNRHGSSIGYWDKIVPKQFIVQGLQQEVLNWLIDRQIKLVEKYGLEDKRIAAFIVLDDVIADQKTIRWSADLARFFVQGRHLAITG